jgi:hypothetical protein
MRPPSMRALYFVLTYIVEFERRSHDGVIMPVLFTATTGWVLL